MLGNADGRECEGSNLDIENLFVRNLNENLMRGTNRNRSDRQSHNFTLLSECKSNKCA